MDKFSGRPRGFGFITMETKEGAEAAIQTLNGKNVDGRDLMVNEARPREETRPRGLVAAVDIVAPIVARAAANTATDPFGISRCGICVKSHTFLFLLKGCPLGRGNMFVFNRQKMMKN